MRSLGCGSLVEMPCSGLPGHFDGAAGCHVDSAVPGGQRGRDLAPFLDAVSGTTIPAPVGLRAGAGGLATGPVLQQVFAGQLGVEEGLKKAQEVGNQAITRGSAGVRRRCGASTLTESGASSEPAGKQGTVRVTGGFAAPIY